MITKEDKILIKNLWESKKYEASDFPSKNWSRRGLLDFLHRLRVTSSIERAPGSGRPRTIHTAENVDVVQELVQSRRTDLSCIFLLVIYLQTTWNLSHNCHEHHSRRSVAEMS